MKWTFSATMRIRPAASAAPIIRSASASVGAIGFSTRTCRPASSAMSASGRCRLWGVHTIAPAARRSRVASSYEPNAAAAPNSRAKARARPGSPLAVSSGIPTTRFEAACASSHAAFRHAVMEIAAGVSDVVLVGGAERVLNVPTAESTEYFAYASDAIWEQTLGLTFPGVFALIARAHMEKYGTTEEQMAAVAVKNHKHGTPNPKAQFQKAITVEQVLQSPYIPDPLKLFDCCPFTDGGAAVVLASEEVARKRTRAVRVLASAAASDWMLLGDKRDLSRVPATERAAAAAYKQAGLTPTDVDGVELHDCFTIAEIVATEGLGLFEPGAGGRAAAEGRTSPGGAIPVNPSGGLKAKGHPIGATGAAQIAEIVTQLRGAAGPRQVADARVRLTHTP